MTTTTTTTAMALYLLREPGDMSLQDHPENAGSLLRQSPDKLQTFPCILPHRTTTPGNSTGIATLREAQHLRESRVALSRTVIRRLIPDHRCRALKQIFTTKVSILGQ